MAVDLIDASGSNRKSSAIGMNLINKMNNVTNEQDMESLIARFGGIFTSR